MNGPGRHVIGQAVERMNAELDVLHAKRAALAEELASMDADIEGLGVARDTLQENLEGDD